jgi:hydrogenase maturation protein HypF
VLTHNREIRNRCDDSVIAAVGRRVMLLRRSRGYVPEPIMLDAGGPSVLATGGMNKVIFALSSGRRVFLSQHIGDVSDADSAAFFAESFADFSRLLRLEPEVVVSDLHPDYPTTEFARAIAAERGLPLLQVQHHYAHIAGCLAEHGESGPVIGVSWDGTGYGEDGAVWGGEFLLADRRAYRRSYHLRNVPMPGGEAAIRHPLRMALAHLARALGPDEAVRRLAPRMGEEACQQALAVMARPRFSPQTSSAGRLFDAVSAYLGICEAEPYEGQPAIEMEAAGAPGPAESYEFGYDGNEVTLDGVWRGICADAAHGGPSGRIVARFHATMARVVVETCRRMREQSGVALVALSGGVMQNRTLLGLAVPALEAEGLRVLLPSLVPPNDAGMSFGQAAWALAELSAEGET